MKMKIMRLMWFLLLLAVFLHFPDLAISVYCTSIQVGPGWNAVVGEAYSFEISYTKWVAF